MIESDPKQLDLLDWLAAQPPGPAMAAAPEIAPAPVTSDSAPVLLTRVDPSCNMHRFYSLALVRSLWGEWGVMRQWGQIGSPGQRRTDWHEARGEAKAELECMTRRKRRRGYR